MAADPVAAAVTLPGSRSSGTEGAAPSPAEAVLNQEAAESPAWGIASMAWRVAIDATWTWRAMPTRTTRRE